MWKHVFIWFGFAAFQIAHSFPPPFSSQDNMPKDSGTDRLIFNFFRHSHSVKKNADSFIKQALKGLPPQGFRTVSMRLLAEYRNMSRTIEDIKNRLNEWYGDDLRDVIDMDTIDEMIGSPMIATTEVMGFLLTADLFNEVDISLISSLRVKIGINSQGLKEEYANLQTAISKDEAIGCLSRMHAYFREMVNTLASIIDILTNKKNWWRELSGDQNSSEESTENWWREGSGDQNSSEESTENWWRNETPRKDESDNGAEQVQSGGNKEDNKERENPRGRKEECNKVHTVESSDERSRKDQIRRDWFRRRGGPSAYHQGRISMRKKRDLLDILTSDVNPLKQMWNSLEGELTTDLGRGWTLGPRGLNWENRDSYISVRPGLDGIDIRGIVDWCSLTELFRDKSNRNREFFQENRDNRQQNGDTAIDWLSRILDKRDIPYEVTKTSSRKRKDIFDSMNRPQRPPPQSHSPRPHSPPENPLQQIWNIIANAVSVDLGRGWTLGPRGLNWRKGYSFVSITTGMDGINIRGTIWY